jgi:hypothetical protein
MLELFPMLLGVAAAGHSPDGAVAQFERWERRLRARVEKLHTMPADARDVPPCDVLVRFAVSQRGSPHQPEIRKSTCGRHYERKALALVRGLGRVGAVPSGAAKDHGVLLKLSYGTAPERSADQRLSAALNAERAMHARRNLAIVALAPLEPAASGRQGGER